MKNGGIVFWRIGACPELPRRIGAKKQYPHLRTHEAKTYCILSSSQQPFFYINLFSIANHTPCVVEKTMDKTTLIKNTILQALPAATVEVEDTMGDGHHFQATVVAPEFKGKTLLEQHRIVFDSLREALKEAVHALSLKTYTPEQWRHK